MNKSTLPREHWVIQHREFKTVLGSDSHLKRKFVHQLWCSRGKCIEAWDFEHCSLCHIDGRGTDSSSNPEFCREIHPNCSQITPSVLQWAKHKQKHLLNIFPYVPYRINTLIALLLWNHPRTFKWDLSRFTVYEETLEKYSSQFDSYHRLIAVLLHLWKMFILH